MEIYIGKKVNLQTQYWNKRNSSNNWYIFRDYVRHCKWGKKIIIYDQCDSFAWNEEPNQFDPKLDLVLIIVELKN